MVEGMAQTPVDYTEDDRLWSLLSFIFPVIGIIVLLIEDKKNRPVLKYHAIVAIILGVASVVLSAVCIGALLWIYSIVLGIKAYKGEVVEVPVISDFVRNQGWA